MKQNKQSDLANLAKLDLTIPLSSVNNTAHSSNTAHSTTYGAIQNTTQPAVLDLLFDKKKVAVIKLFIHNKEKQFYLKEISELANVPIATVHRILQKLVSSKIITQTNIAKFKVYKLNTSQETEEQLAMLESIIPKDKTVLDLVVADLKSILGVNTIILHGELAASKATIVLLGENVDNEKVKQAVAGFKQKHNFTIIEMVVTAEHFENMRKSGLISGEIKVLYERV